MGFSCCQQRVNDEKKFKAPSPLVFLLLALLFTLVTQKGIHLKKLRFYLLEASCRILGQNRWDRHRLATGEKLSGPGNCISLFMKKDLNDKNRLHVNTSIKTLLRVRPLGFDTGKFRLPIAKDMGGNPSQFTHLADLKVKLVRYFRSHVKVLPLLKDEYV
jgi:hypothetical protein